MIQNCPQWVVLVPERVFRAKACMSEPLAERRNLEALKSNPSKRKPKDSAWVPKFGLD